MGGTSSSFTDEKKNVVDVRGLATNSASPTDTWIVTYEKNGKRTNLFWKLFVTSSEENKQPEIRGLEYEIKVYREITQPLLDNKVCPFFVKYYSDFTGVSMEDLQELSGDYVNVEINTKYLACISSRTEEIYSLFQNNSVSNMSEYCKKRGVVKKVNSDVDYVLWMGYHNFPSEMIDTFDCLVLKENFKKPMFFSSGNMNPLLIDHLKRLSVVEFNRFFREIGKLSLGIDKKEYSKSIIRQRLDNNFILNDLFFSKGEVDNETKKSLKDSNITSEGDYEYAQISSKEPSSYNLVNSPEQQKERQKSWESSTAIENEAIGKFKFNILVTESTPPNTKTLKEFLDTILMEEPVGSLSTLVTSEVTEEEMSFANQQKFYTVYFQLCIACYTMSLSKMVHNDLHVNNVFVTKLDKPELNVFFIFTEDGGFKKYHLLSEYKVMVYDYDKAYVVKFGDNLSVDESSGQSNEFIQMLDIFKVSCYLCRTFNNKAGKSIFASMVFGLLSRKNDFQDMYNKYVTTTDPSCFFSTRKVKEGLKVDPADLGKSWLNDYPTIIDKVYTKIKKVSDEKKVSEFYVIDEKFFDKNTGKLNVKDQQDKVVSMKNLLLNSKQLVFLPPPPTISPHSNIKPPPPPLPSPQLPPQLPPPQLPPPQLPPPPLVDGSRRRSPRKIKNSSNNNVVKKRSPRGRKLY